MSSSRFEPVFAKMTQMSNFEIKLPQKSNLESKIIWKDEAWTQKGSSKC